MAQSGARTTTTGSLYATIQRLFGNAIRKAYPRLPIQEPKILPSNPKFGDYQCNNAMEIFNRYKGEPCIGKAENVKQVAEAIARELKALSSQGDAGGSVNMLEADPVIAPNGFITVKFNLSWINDQGVILLERGFSGYQAEKRQRVVVDFSSPNIAKEMHVGHLRFYFSFA